MIEERMAALRRALLSRAPAHDEDWLLHRAILEATGNDAFVAIFDRLQDRVIHILRAGVDISHTRPPHVIEAMTDEHDAIVDAIRTQGGDGTALAMLWHLWQRRKRLMP
nr:FCD domain-containing protein [Sphingomonas sp. BK481]